MKWSELKKYDLCKDVGVRDHVKGSMESFVFGLLLLMKLKRIEYGSK